MSANWPIGKFACCLVLKYQLHHFNKKFKKNSDLPSCQISESGVFLGQNCGIDASLVITLKVDVPPTLRE